MNSLSGRHWVAQVRPAQQCDGTYSGGGGGGQPGSIPPAAGGGGGGGGGDGGGGTCSTRSSPDLTRPRRAPLPAVRVPLGSRPSPTQDPSESHSGTVRTPSPTQVPSEPPLRSRHGPTRAPSESHSDSTPAPFRCPNQHDPLSGIAPHLITVLCTRLPPVTVV